MASVAAVPSNSSAAAAPAGNWMLQDVERALADGVRLRRWWEDTQARGAFARSFGFLEGLTPPDRAIGFFDRTEVSSGAMDVMGLSHEMVFDRPKDTPPETTRRQIREFALRYFLRVSELTQPQPAQELGMGSLTGVLLKLLRLGSPKTVVHNGFRYTQLYSKEAATGRIVEVPAERQASIVDLREVGPRYEWIILQARPFDYELDLAPAGPAGPRVVLPLPDSPVIAINPAMVVDQDRPSPGVLGRYGFTYALLNDPTPRGAQVYGPAQYRACFQTIHFEVLESGETRAHLAFTGNLPGKILDVKLDPIGLAMSAGDFFSLGLTTRLLKPVEGLLAMRPVLGSFDPLLGFLSLVNVATAGFASEALSLSREQLFRDILARHFQIYYQLILAGVLAYQQVSDWLDTAALPAWARDPHLDA